MPSLADEYLIDNLKKYKTVHYHNQPHSVWHRVLVARRSSVFVLLFLGALGEWRVVLTKRSSKLRNFPGHISLPGGKADTALETEWEVARREMCEEIGIEANDDTLWKNWRVAIERVNILPCYLSRTFSAVSPCVGILRFSKNKGESEIINKLTLNLNPGESSNIFSCPLRDFIYPAGEDKPLESMERSYNKVKWGGIPWNLRSYVFLQDVPNEVQWLRDIKDLSASEDESQNDSDDIGHSNKPKNRKVRLSSWGNLGSRRHSETNEKVYDVWGLTANILHDLASIIYTGKADSVVGEEELIYSIWEEGNLMRTKERSEAEQKLIRAGPGDPFGFNSILPRTEFNRLKNIYKL
ncbi:uncharacterized protein PRCAT00004380001 [Priceomyces carsonii]|uniref:uncharacterized protein n=1 Tax=Priceomyces carsonii TaxID=28549 RepID=UPI002EDB6FE6|nr:unnamed protein product [Priceomyces carsonii]